MKSYNERAEATREKIKIYKNKAKTRRKILISLISVCSCLLIAFNLVMFIPYTTYPSVPINLSEYKNSEYYDLIKELSYIQYGDSVKPVYKNNFQRLADSFKKGASGENGGIFGDADQGMLAPGGSGDSSGASGSEHYEETTDNQVAGVIEGDLLKRTDKYIYYLAVQNFVDYPRTLRVYPIDGLETECIAEFKIAPQPDFSYYSNNVEMYLSENGSTVTLVLPCNRIGVKYSNKIYTEVVNIDVSDHSHIKITGRYLVSGNYVSSRLVDGELLLVTNYTVQRGVDFSDEEQFVPATGAFSNIKCIPANNIHCPKQPEYSRFTVVCTVDAQTLEETGSQAFLSYSNNVYVSENNIYLVNNYNSYNEQPFKKSIYTLDYEYHYMYYETKAEISRVEYGDKLEYKGSFTVEGEVKNRFCMDEKDGVLRVVTSLQRYEYINFNKYHTGTYIINGASLYCVDIQNYNVVGKLENFAPEDDTVQSVRFDGDKVYVCTAIVFIMTDPVFAIDISDYNNIHFVDTGEISGYSIALRKFYGDTLLGIGYDGNNWSGRNLKIELYKETESTVKSVATFTYNGDGYDYINVQFSTEYKAYFIDAERGLIGLGLTVEACDFTNGGYYTFNRYILLQYDGENLNLLLDIELDRRSAREYYFYDVARAVYVDGAFYLFTENGLTVTELNV